MLFSRRLCNRKVLFCFLSIFFIEQGFSVPSATLWAETKDSSESVNPGAISGTNDRVENPKVENIISVDYEKLLVDDTWHILSAPARWNTTDWFIAGLGTSAVVGTVAFADRFLKKNIQKNRNNTTDNFAKAVQPFGAEYSFGVLGAFELGGYAFKDETAKAVVNDGLSSSLIASGIITSSLKYIVGRARPSREKGTHHFSPFSRDNSFPSGHATQAFAVASVIADHYDSWWVKVASYGVASAVGYARMEQNAHFASDVLAGAIIGTFVGRTIVKFNRQKRYEIAPFVDTDAIGMQVTKPF